MTAHTARLVAERLGFGRAQGATLLRHGENAVYRVELAGGRLVAVRVHRSGYHSTAAIAAELTWMRALAAEGIATPEPLGGVMEVDDGAGTRHRCTAFAWVDGAPLAAGDPEATLPRLGALMARMHAQARAWTPPAGWERPCWDAAALTGDSPRWGRFELATDWPADVLRDLERARAVVAEQLARLGTGRDEFGLIHADLTPTNVLVQGDTPHVIDFDDCGPGWFAYDAAVALWEWQEDPRFPRLCDGLLDGYAAECGSPLPGADRLPALLMARRLALLGWIATRAESGHAHATRARRIATSADAARRFLATT